MPGDNWTRDCLDSKQRRTETKGCQSDLLYAQYKAVIKHAQPCTASSFCVTTSVLTKPLPYGELQYLSKSIMKQVCLQRRITNGKNFLFASQPYMKHNCNYEADMRLFEYSNLQYLLDFNVGLLPTLILFKFYSHKLKVETQKISTVKLSKTIGYKQTKTEQNTKAMTVIHPA